MTTLDTLLNNVGLGSTGSGLVAGGSAVGLAVVGGLLYFLWRFVFGGGGI